MKVPPVTVLRSQTADVACVAVSAEGKLLLTGSADGTVSVWAVDTRRVMFALPKAGTHGGTGILQAAFLHPPGDSSPCPRHARFATMGRDGCIRFWGCFLLAGPERKSPVSIESVLDAAASGRSHVASTEPAGPAEAPRLPPMDQQVDYGDFVLAARPAHDCVFEWGSVRFEIACLATLWHSSYSFCKFEVRSGARGCQLLVPSDTQSIVRVYTLWGEAPVAGEPGAVGRGRMHKRAVPGIDDFLNDVHASLLNPPGTDSGLPAPVQPARFVADLVPPAAIATGMPMVIDGLMDQGLACVGYESGHVVAFFMAGDEPFSAYCKAHKDAVLSAALVQKQGAPSPMVATGAADRSVRLYGVSRGTRALVPLGTIRLAAVGAGSLAFHPTNPRLLCVGLWDHTVKVYDVRSQSVARNAKAAAAEADDDNDEEDGAAAKREATQPLVTLVQHKASISSVSWVRGPGEGTALIFAASTDGTISAWDAYSKG
ncbi:hypothetical protein DIPPA_12451 [Diplonema papillatum]|nr:hypothetical protein DIPPA_12451 [Diplonema papillatum]